NLESELLAAGFRQCIEARAAIVLRCAPCGCNPPLMLEAMQRRIQRALLDTQQVIGDLLNALCDRPAVHGLHRERSHDEKVEGPLQDVRLVAHLSVQPLLQISLGEKTELTWKMFHVPGSSLAFWLPSPPRAKVDKRASTAHIAMGSRESHVRTPHALVEKI